MQVTETHSEGLKRVFRVVIPATELQARLDQRIEEVRPKLNINGFRKGKVPASHVRKLYGASMLQEIIDGEVDAAAKKALQDGALRVMTGPSLRLESDMQQVAAGQADLTFSLDVELIPDFDLVDLAEIEIERLTAPVADQQIDEVVKRIADANRSYVEKDGVAEEGDSLLVDFVGKIDGEPFEGGAAEGASVVIGSGQLIPGFEESLKGAAKGEDRTINVTFPDDYPSEALKGKAATFDVKVHEVRAPEDAALDDTLAEKAGFASMEELRDAVRKQLEAEHAAQSRTHAKRQLFDKLEAAHNFELPAGVVDQEFAQIWREVEEAQKRGDVDPDDADKTEAEMRDDYRRIAERRVKLGLVLAEIGRRNNITVGGEELGRAIAAQARRYPGQERQVFEMFQKNEQLLNQVRAPLFEEKTVDFALELVKSTPKEVDRETLFTEPSA